jgi:acyl-coenzyme A thioesterase PaaI-like protein
VPARSEGSGGEGYCTIEVPFGEGVTQQERYFHGAVIGAVGDNAGGYAALSSSPVATANP